MSKVQPVLNDPDPIAPRLVDEPRGDVPGIDRAPRMELSAAELLVRRAEQFAVANIGRRLRVGDLVATTGADEDVLRRAVHAQTGQTLRDFILTLRLVQARAWLSSERELRSLREIAAALGFRHLGRLSRAYSDRFGESMTETRRRAVSAAVAPKYLSANRFAEASIFRVDAKLSEINASRVGENNSVTIVG